MPRGSVRMATRALRACSKNTTHTIANVDVGSADGLAQFAKGDIKGFQSTRIDDDAVLLDEPADTRNL